MATSGAFEHNMEPNVVTAAEIRNVANCEPIKSDHSLTAEPTGRIKIEGLGCAGGLNRSTGPFVRTGP
jgi:hypothetical protein